jgi:putative zinc finger protein
MVQPLTFREGIKAMVNREAMNCEQIWKEISDYIEGEVSPAMRTAMDDHFHTCQRCRSVLEGTRNVIHLYRDERMIDVPSGFGRRLEKRLAQSVRAQGRGWSTWSAWLIPIAALALFAGGLRWANSLTNSHPLLSEHAQPAHNIPPDMKVVVSEGARDFHVPGCEFIHNKDKERTLTAREAIREGYVPCVRCMRKYLQTASNVNRPLDSEALADIDDDDHQNRLR